MKFPKVKVSKISADALTGFHVHLVIGDSIALTITVSRPVK